MSIVQGLVALHGGEVDIASRLGQGTRVSVRLPIDCEVMRPARKDATVASPKFGLPAAPQLAIKKSA
jgi:cell cycle sensor histidine kinase DivJ